MPKEHPHPTPATAKLLYANAFSCGFEGCKRPLYKVDERTSERILNSTICHINARSEGGPRWDKDQTADENRSPANLILMCIEHSATIDDEKTKDAYSAPLLLEWKARQLDEYNRVQQGWTLNDKMAFEAITKSAVTHFDFSHANIKLGGMGGKSPGAGGGGGGAIGPNSRGGDGGGGGDSYSALITTPEDPTGLGHISQIKVGKGGDGARLPGQHGAAGEDTILKLLARDGTLLQEVRAKSGPGGRSGASFLPEGTKEISPDDIENGFRISTFLTCNCGELRDGLLSLISAGWSYFGVKTLPCDAVWNVAFIASWTDEAISFPKGMYVSLHDPDGNEKACIAVSLLPDDPKVMNRVWLGSIGAVIDQAGAWHLCASSGGLLLTKVVVQVVSNEQPNQSPSATKGATKSI